MKKNLSVIILAGGNSERFNYPKPFLPFNSKNSFLGKLIKTYFDFGCSEIIIVLNVKYSSSPHLKKFDKIKNIVIQLNDNPELGRFFSLKLGVDKLQQYSFTFIQNVDNPFTDFALLDKLYNARIDDGYSVPLYNNKRGHPVLMGNKIIQRIKNEKRLNLVIKDVLHEYNRAEVEVDDDRVCININFIEDYKRYFKTDLNKLSLDEEYL